MRVADAMLSRRPHGRLITVAAIVATLAVVACGPRGGGRAIPVPTPFGTPETLRPQTSPTPQPSYLAQGLTFSGAISGLMSQSVVRTCSKEGGALHLVIAAAEGTDPVVVDVTIPSGVFRGTGTYDLRPPAAGVPAPIVTVRGGGGLGYSSVAGSGSVTLDADRLAGSLQADLVGGPGGSGTDRLRLAGTWRCAASSEPSAGA